MSNTFIKKVKSLFKNPTIRWGIVIGIILGIAFYNYRTSPEIETFSNNECVVRMFYVNWCGHCKKSKPEFQQFMQKYNNTQVKGKNVKIEMIDCEENSANKQLASKYNVKGYPTIIAHLNGKNIDYEGERNTSGFDTWLNSILS
jgi:thiol-disulfide isomerase/thioredoxin